MSTVLIIPNFSSFPLDHVATGLRTIQFLLPYPTETLSQTKMNSSRVSVTDFSTSSRILDPFLAREIQTVFVTLLLSDG
jgi:hypothetical protein